MKKEGEDMRKVRRQSDGQRFQNIQQMPWFLVLYELLLGFQFVEKYK